MVEDESGVRFFERIFNLSDAAVWVVLTKTKLENPTQRCKGETSTAAQLYPASVREGSIYMLRLLLGMRNQ